MNTEIPIGSSRATVVSWGRARGLIFHDANSYAQTSAEIEKFTDSDPSVACPNYHVVVTVFFDKNGLSKKNMASAWSQCF